MAPESTRTSARTSKVRTSVPTSDPKEDASPRPNNHEPVQSPAKPIADGKIHNGNQSSSKQVNQAPEQTPVRPIADGKIQNGNQSSSKQGNHEPVQSPARPIAGKIQNGSQSSSKQDNHEPEQTSVRPIADRTIRNSNSPSLNPEQSSARLISDRNILHSNPAPSRQANETPKVVDASQAQPINRTPVQSRQSTASSEQAEQAEQSNNETPNSGRSRLSSSPQAYKKRRTITQFEKIEICKKAKDIYLSHKKIADMFGIERTAVTKIVKESDYWLSLKGRDLSIEGMSRIRRTAEDFQRSKGILPPIDPSLEMQQHPYYNPHQPHIPMGYPPHQHPPPSFIKERCDHQVHIARLQDVIGTLQRYHKGTEDAVERLQKVVDSLTQGQ